MAPPAHGVVEEFAVGLYLLVLCGSIAGFGCVHTTDGPVIGGAFVVIGLFWLTVLASVWASLVVLAIRSLAYLRDGTLHRRTVTFATVTPLAFGVATYLPFVTPHHRLWVLVGGLGFLSSLGLVVSVLEGRARRLRRRLAR